MLPLSALQGGRGRGPRRRRGRVRWVGAGESPTSPEPSPPPRAERERRAGAIIRNLGSILREPRRVDHLAGGDLLGPHHDALAVLLPLHEELVDEAGPVLHLVQLV